MKAVEEIEYELSSKHPLRQASHSPADLQNLFKFAEEFVEKYKRMTETERGEQAEGEEVGYVPSSKRPFSHRPFENLSTLASLSTHYLPRSTAQEPTNPRVSASRASSGKPVMRSSAQA